LAAARVSQTVPRDSTELSGVKAGHGCVASAKSGSAKDGGCDLDAGVENGAADGGADAEVASTLPSARASGTTSLDSSWRDVPCCSSASADCLCAEVAVSAQITQHFTLPPLGQRCLSSTTTSDWEVASTSPCSDSISATTPLSGSDTFSLRSGALRTSFTSSKASCAVGPASESAMAAQLAAPPPWPRLTSTLPDLELALQRASAARGSPSTAASSRVPSPAPSETSSPRQRSPSRERPLSELDEKLRGGDRDHSADAEVAAARQQPSPAWSDLVSIPFLALAAVFVSEGTQAKE